MKLPELPSDTSPAVREAFEVLARESAELRAEVDALKRSVAGRPVATTGPTPASPVAPRATEVPNGAAPQPRTVRRGEPARDALVDPTLAPVVRPRARVDMEKLLGRYGAWAAAALMILLGVGTLLEWAIRNGLFGPAARVALSSVLAVALAAGGYMLRERAAAAGESRGYGNACLALALGVLEVVAWQIGPQWHMVPPVLALVLADVGAAALVSFGVREEDELLAACGAAGLYLAPFVTSSGEGSALVLASYVTLVSLALLQFVEHDSWRVARAVIRWGSLLCVLALIAMNEAVLGAIVASVLAVAMLRVDTPVVLRLKTVAAYIAAASIATLAASSGARVAWIAALAFDRHTGWLASVALLVALLVASRFALWALSPDQSPLSLTFTLLLPVAAVLSAATALPGDATLDMVWLSAATGLSALAVALWSDAPNARSYYTTGFVLLWAGAMSYSSRGVRISEAMLLGVTLVALWLVRERPNVRIARFAAFASAVCVALVSAARVYVAESQVVPRAWHDIVLLAGACVALVSIARLRVENEGAEIRVVRVGAPWIAGLLLARHLTVLASGAYTAVALTAFYAATGVAFIILGRRRDSLALRRGGLGLALYAPLRAIATATDVENTGVRVSVYFVAGAFMLLVAFLYRSRRDGEAQTILADVATHE